MYQVQIKWTDILKRDSFTSQTFPIILFNFQFSVSFHQYDMNENVQPILTIKLVFQSTCSSLVTD